MAKNHKKGNGKKKPNQNGYFASNIKRSGKDFLKLKRDDELRRDAPRIFKDIAFCFGDVGQIVPYFMDKRLVTILYQYAKNASIEYSMTSKGLSTYVQNNAQDPTLSDPTLAIEDMIKTKAKLASAYSIINGSLNNLINILSVDQNLDKLVLYCHIGMELKAMSVRLKDYRYLL